MTPEQLTKRAQRPGADRGREAGLPLRLHTAAEAAEIVRGTESWLKDKARRREIPFTMIAGQYRFTDAHLEEIVRIFEELPEPQRDTIPARRASKATGPPDAPALRARRPRRAPGGPS